MLGRCRPSSNPMMLRTRVKICGLTRAADVAAACEAGADAVGFVCYPGSPRHVPCSALSTLARAAGPFVSPVLLFVNARPQDVWAALDVVPHAVLQFHGGERHEECRAFGRPYLRALSMGEGVDLLDCERQFPSAQAILADAPSRSFGGAGAVFDWHRVSVSADRKLRLVLAGGLTVANVSAAIAAVSPWAVDVSSGVEVARGIKDHVRMREFIAAVHAADAQRTAE